jgi:hypothetical protein
MGEAAVVAWDEAAEQALRARGAAVRTVAQILGAEAAEEVDAAAVRWTKEWGRRPLLDGCCFRDLYEWKGVSLWWFAELFLHHSTEATRFVRVIETVHRLLDAEAPDEMEAHGLPEDEALLAARTCLARGVLFHGGSVRRAARRGVPGVRRRARWNAVKAWATAAKAAASGPAPTPGPGAPVALFLSHAAFWRDRTSDTGGAPRTYEHYFDRLIPALGEDGALRPFVVAVGPRRGLSPPRAGRAARGLAAPARGRRGLRPRQPLLLPARSRARRGGAPRSPRGSGRSCPGSPRCARPSPIAAWPSRT